MKVRCGKRKYRTELDAKIALVRCQWKDHGERRTYHHAACHAWHLTSMSHSGRMTA